MDMDRLLDDQFRPIPPGMALRTITAEDLARLRAGRPTNTGDELVNVDARMETAPGDPDVVLRVFRPKGAKGLLPCIYWMHGGGYIAGNCTQDDVQFDRWCSLFDCMAVAVEYRLAPEHPYPAAIEDCYTGLAWTHEHAAELGVDPGVIGLGGRSAGGGLTAALAQVARDRGQVPLAFQYMAFAMLDDRQRTPSAQWDVPVWPPGANDFGWRSYLGAAFGSEVPASAAQARSEELTGLPPALIVVGGLDGNVDENIDYAQRLNHAGVPTELHVYPRAPHGFDRVAPEAPTSRRAREATEEWLATMLRVPGQR